MGAAEHLVGRQLDGKKTKWIVTERIHREHDGPDGIFFSAGYKVKSDDGREAFMKATDADLVAQSHYSMAERSIAALQQHISEAKMLDRCRGNNMDRIALAIDHGEAMIEHAGVKEAVFYIFFDLAECDVRVQVDKQTRFDIFWAYSALHDLAVAIQQLHQGKITHNDTKPANFLVFLHDVNFKDRIHKLADLGCATSPVEKSIYDEAICVGDHRYTAPEIMYAKEADVALRTFEARRCVDIFHLGSMIFFLVTGRMLTIEIIRHLPPEQRPPNDDTDWASDYRDVIPYWREAFGRVLVDFKRQLPLDAKGKLTPASEKLIDALVQLTDPDPALRGHPLNRVGHADRLSVQLYISLFNSLRRGAMN
jgi:serine/threonine protein kinase